MLAGLLNNQKNNEEYQSLFVRQPSYAPQTWRQKLLIQKFRSSHAVQSVVLAQYVTLEGS